MAAIGMTVLWQHATGTEIVALDWLAPALAVGDVGEKHFRMAPSTALCLTLAGIGIVGLAYRASAGFIVACAVALAVVDVIGIFGLDATLNGIGLPAHSLPSAVALLCLSVCLLALSGARTPKLTLKMALTGLVLGALIPAALLVAIQARRVTAQRLEEIGARTNDIASKASHVLEQVVMERAVMLRALAASPALKSGDLAAFYAHASEIVKFPDSAIVVGDASMKMLLSTAMPYGTPLPDVADPVTSKRAHETGMFEVSDVYISPLKQQPIFGVVMAVPGTGFHLRVTMSGYALSEMLAAAAPAGWVIGLLDRQRTIAARSSEAERWIGKTASERLQRQADPVVARGRGFIRTTSIEGKPSYISYNRSSTGWSGVAVAEEAMVDVLARNSGQISVFGWPLAAALGIALATLAAIAVGRALARLSHAAESIGKGDIPMPIHSGIVEIDRVAAALTSSGAILARSESEARRQELLFRTVFDSNPDGMMLADIDRRIIRVNPAFSRIFGFDAGEIEVAPTKTLYADAADWTAVGQAFNVNASSVVAGRYAFRRKCGESFPGFLTAVRLLDGNGQFIAYLSIVRDLTVELLREQALLEKRNLEALGRLSSGIAHDFNNILTIVSANLQLIEARENDPKCLEWTQQAEQAAQMGARLNQRLMTFARQRRLEPTVVDINELVKSALELVRRATGESIEVRAVLAAGPALVWIEESEMENALVNLALNARDAMRDGGRMLVETGNTIVAAADPLVSAGLAPGHYVRVSVTDTGTGMTDEVRSRAFEPFFTTKAPGKGTGLGLTSIHGFVTQLGGTVTIESKLDQGTCVTILLPLHQPSAGDSVGPGKDAAAVYKRGNGERILLVEDNSAVRKATAELLQQHGYVVLQVDSSYEALKVIDHDRNVDLVISDIVLPGTLSGLDLLKKINSDRPDLKLLLCSGSTELAAAAEFLRDRRVLRKPFSRAQLLAAVAGAMVLSPAKDAAIVAA